MIGNSSYVYDMYMYMYMYMYISVVTNLNTENPRSEMYESGKNPDWSEYQDVFFPKKNNQISSIVPIYAAVHIHLLIEAY